MTDLEMTKMCAEAMGWKYREENFRDPSWPSQPLYQGYFDRPEGTSIKAEDYDPLHDDAQAMALVKKLKLTIVWTDARLDGWRVRGWRTGKTGALCEEVDNDDLNRAIIECVAKMQGEKP